MKPILLYIDDEMCQFDTVKEATEYAEDRDNGMSEFHIYTLFSRAQRRELQWKLATDTATNLRENKKEKGKTRAGTWTRTEMDTAVEHYEKGVPVAKIAEGLKRSYAAVYSKLDSLGVIVKEGEK